jgi:hypothetical protein
LRGFHLTDQQGRPVDASLDGVSAVFDDPNLVSAAGLAPVLALAERAGLHELVGEHLAVPGSAGPNAAIKVPALVAGMVAGADSISDMGLLRHGGMGRLFERCGRRRRWAHICAVPVGSRPSV